MNNIEYFPANTVKEACNFLSQYGEEAKILGGGQSLINLMKQKLISPSYIIDIKGISDLDYIQYDENDGLRIGALTTHRSLEKSEIVNDKFPLLAEMERSLASVAVRNWGTIGGNLCHADPASDPGPCLMALDAEVKLTGLGGERVVGFDNFFVDYFETVIQPDEILTEIHVPNSAEKSASYLKFAYRPTDLSVVSIATHLILDPADPDLCKEIRIAMGSVGPTPLRSKRGEDIIKGQKIDDTVIAEVAKVSSEDAQPTGDMNGSEEYKREIVKVLVKRAIEKAAVRAEKPRV
jgi:carbon-monoxide dehydrogenase medium subunit